MGMAPVEETTGLSAEQLRRIDLLCDEFEPLLRARQSPRIEDFVARVDEPMRVLLLTELIRMEVEWGSVEGSTRLPREYEKRFPQYAGQLPGWLEETASDPSPGPSNGDTVYPSNLSSTPEHLCALESPPLLRLGEYDLLRLIGEGGMGQVYEGRHRRLGKRVAVKLLSKRRGYSPVVMERFHREMAAVGQLENPHLVVAHDAGKQDGVAYLVLEYIDGIDLSRLVKEKGPLPIHQACDLIRQAALGVQYLHEHNLVHRDIKPGNMMLLPEGRLKVLDLGLARRQEVAKESLTEAGSPMGTPDYMSPEQGTNAADAGPATDLYALGCSLFSLLTGKPPFAHHIGMLEKTKAHAAEAPPDVRSLRPEVPARVAAIVSRLLAKRPEGRYQSARELAEELERISRKPKWWRWLAVAVGILTCCLLAALLGWALRSANQLHETPGLLDKVVSKPEEVIKQFEVRHLAREEGGVRPSGILGVKSFATRLRDFVTVDATLAEPRYCYLIAFCPDGTDRLVFPVKKNEPPGLSIKPGYPPPEKIGKAYGLTEGVGLQAFFLVVSRKPLPVYEDWKQALGGLPWTREPAVAGVVWHYDGVRLKQYTAEDPGGKRGEDEDLPGAGPLVRLIEKLRGAADVEVVSGIAFAVMP